MATELIEFHNLPYIPADTKWLVKRAASQEANTMARPRLPAAVNLSLYNSWLKIAGLLVPQQSPNRQRRKKCAVSKIQAGLGLQEETLEPAALPQIPRGITSNEGVLNA